jgi:hypothetical protein
MYGPAAKAHFLKLDARDSMCNGIMGAMLDPLQGGGCPYLLLTVRRGPELVRDALTRIRAAMHGNTLKRPLKVRGVPFLISFS